MIAQKKYAECRRSYKDHAIFQIFYINANLAEIAKMVPTVILQEVVKKGKMLGTVYEKESVINCVQSPISGTIVQIKQIKPQSSKTKLVHIFSIRGCEHFPKDKNQDTQQNPLLANKSILQTADICSICQQPLWFYYQKKEKQIKLRQLKKHFSNFNFQELQWKVVPNEQYTKDTQICGTSEESYCMEKTGKITFMYDFTEKEPNHDTVVIKYKDIVCKHEKLSNGMCLFCLTDIKSLPNINLRRYLFQFDQENFDYNLIVSGSSLDFQAQQFRNQMVKSKKCLLVLDLDNTILHSISLRKVDDQMIDSIEEYAIIPPEETTSIFIQKTLVKFRPNFQYFLSKAIELFQIFIYTKGTRLYAEYICKVVRQKYQNILKGSKNFLPHRVISRDEDPNLEKKNLDYIIPENRQIMLILDDRRDVWNHSPLCVFTRPYIFFYYVEVTVDGKTKLQPVQWEKGGGTLQHKLNEFQQNCIKIIEQAENCGKEELAAQKIKQLQEQISLMQKSCQQLKMVICVPQSSLQAKTQEKQIQQQEKRIQKLANKSQQIVKSLQKAVLKVQKLQKASGSLRNNSNIPDQFLITTLFALKQAHTLFFQKLELSDDDQKKQGKYADLCFCFQEYKKSLLDHLTVCFVSTSKDYKKSGVYRRAQKLGLKIVDNVNQHIDLIIRPNNFLAGYAQNSIELGNKHYNEVIKKIKLVHQAKKIPIVSQTWIDICYQFNCCVHHSYFEAENALSKAIFTNDNQLRKAVGQSTLNVAEKIKLILKDGQNFEEAST